jgi:Fic family protein
MLDKGPKGFQDGMSAKKYMSITGASKVTATRAPQDLAEAQLDFTTAHAVTVPFD